MGFKGRTAAEADEAQRRTEDDEPRRRTEDERESETTNEHSNYFRWFTDDDNDDDDDNITSSIRANAGPPTDSRTEEINDLRRRVGEHDRRLQRIEKIFKAMTYVIVFCVFLYFIM
ncbi:unnamed protein product [Camellia sinensis]